MWTISYTAKTKKTKKNTDRKEKPQYYVCLKGYYFCVMTFDEKQMCALHERTGKHNLKATNYESLHTTLSICWCFLHYIQ